MKDFLNQIHRVLDLNLYYIGLYICLGIPDICGAICSDNGEAKGEKYKQWFDKYVGPKYSGFLTGEDCYFFRCSFLHQGSSQHPKSTYSRVIFIEPPARNVFHCNVINDALNLDVRIFCADIISGAESWLKEYEGTEIYERNYSKFMRRYPNGLHPYIVGVPVIS
jgi:hypothetical protein